MERAAATLGGRGLLAVNAMKQRTSNAQASRLALVLTTTATVMVFVTLRTPTVAFVIAMQRMLQKIAASNALICAVVTVSVAMGVPVTVRAHATQTINPLVVPRASVGTTDSATIVSDSVPGVCRTPVRTTAPVSTLGYVNAIVREEGCVANSSVLSALPITHWCATVTACAQEPQRIAFVTTTRLEGFGPVLRAQHVTPTMVVLPVLLSVPSVHRTEKFVEVRRLGFATRPPERALVRQTSVVSTVMSMWKTANVRNALSPCTTDTTVRVCAFAFTETAAMVRPGMAPADVNLAGQDPIAISRARVGSSTLVANTGPAFNPQQAVNVILAMRLQTVLFSALVGERATTKESASTELNETGLVYAVASTSGRRQDAPPSVTAVGTEDATIRTSAAFAAPISRAHVASSVSPATMATNAAVRRVTLEIRLGTTAAALQDMQVPPV